ncbi:hypothetical protein HanRHA438_Chr16g0740551 [Helianthus annuus]|nr:hypothetical protein HanRHA438_Chr16g0740551 [Helianthus annuus]
MMISYLVKKHSRNPYAGHFLFFCDQRVTGRCLNKRLLIQRSLSLYVQVSRLI